MTRDYDAAAEMDAIYGEQEALGVAFRKFVNHVAGTNEDADVEVIEATFRALDEVDTLQERVDELETQKAALQYRLDKLGNIGEEKTSKEQKIASIVTYADNARREDLPAVTVLPKNVKGVADVSRRYAYDLVDAMVSEFDWAHDPQEIDRHLEQDTPQKGVFIDFEGVHGTPVDVNKFTTSIWAGGVAD